MSHFFKALAFHMFFLHIAEELPADGRIVFKKPVKRPSSVKLNTSSKKKKEEKEKTSSSSSKGKKVKNSSLLSFDDEDGDDE